MNAASLKILDDRHEIGRGARETVEADNDQDVVGDEVAKQAAQDGKHARRTRTMLFEDSIAACGSQCIDLRILDFADRDTDVANEAAGPWRMTGSSFFHHSGIDCHFRFDCT